MTEHRDRDESQVDARFLLANERTLLAWVRTSLALLASGGAVHQFAEVSGRRAIAILLTVVGIAAAVAGGWRYRRTAALLQDGLAPPPTGWLPWALAFSVGAIGVVLLVAVTAG